MAEVDSAYEETTTLPRYVMSHCCLSRHSVCQRMTLIVHHPKRPPHLPRIVLRTFPADGRVRITLHAWSR